MYYDIICITSCTVSKQVNKNVRHKVFVLYSVPSGPRL